MRLHIGLDDTDSTDGGCTTYIAARAVESLAKLNVEFIDYPNIVRLNPNIPYKTRGNGAVAIRLETKKEVKDQILETVLKEIEKNSQIDSSGTDPASILIEGKLPREVRRLSRRALWSLVRAEEAVKTLKRVGGIGVSYRSELGLVGALAAVGQTLDGDHTFELIAYRRRENCGKPRKISLESVIRMDRATHPQTFNNYDYRNGRVLVTPHGPDPVLFGIRGENCEAVKRAFGMLRPLEPVERWLIFRTNQGTDAHLNTAPKDEKLRPWCATIIRGTVSSKPRRIRGGHVFFTINSKQGTIQCAAFEPTGALRDIAAKLLPGDKLTVYGGLKQLSRDHDPTINLEKIKIQSLTDNLRAENPICTRCGKHLKSSGRDQGYECKKCRLTRINKDKTIIKIDREIKGGLYLPDLKAMRHLTKPLTRYSRRRKSWDGKPPRGIWHQP